jgi:hypothetical protein
MVNLKSKSQLKRAHNALFRRSADEQFSSMHDLHEHCRQEKQFSSDVWQMPQSLRPHLAGDSVSLTVDGQDDVRLNDWSFTQFCRLAGVSKDTLNRLSAETASRVLQETVPSSEKPMQLLTTGQSIRSMHGVSYTRLWNAQLLDVVQEYAADFQPPQRAAGGGTGLYCGEQDLFAFLIDPTGWAEIDGEAFAPGFFVWNSEVGRRSLGVQTFWFQSVCANHIVWDATEVVEFTRKHTANVKDGLNEIRSIIERLVVQRNARRDSFVQVMRKATTTKLGADAEEVLQVLSAGKIPAQLAKDALEIARQQGQFTIFALVDALTRLSQRIRYAGDRTDIDGRIGALLEMAV